MKNIFIFFISILLFICIVYLISPSYESFSSSCLSSEEVENIVVDAATNATINVVNALSDDGYLSANEQSLSNNTTTLKFTQFIIYEDRFYAISKDNKLYSKYMYGDNWFILYSNYDKISIINDIFVIRYKNNLYIYALFGTLLCRKLVDNYEESWIILNDNDIKEITGNKKNLILNNSEEGLLNFNYSTSSITDLKDNSNYTSIRMNPYNEDDFWYSLFTDDKDILVVKSYKAEGKEDDIFDFEVKFIDIFISNNYVYGYGSDHYIYRKSISENSFSWHKISSRIYGLINTDKGKKKMSIHDNYIYCLINNQIKKHKINGYAWLDINDLEHENQYYSPEPSKILSQIHKNLNISSNVKLEPSLILNI